MNSASESIQPMNDTFCSKVNYRRIAVIGVALPALLASTNQFILSQLTHTRPHEITIACVMAFYVLQIGTIGWLVGSYINHVVLRWFLFAWIMILIDLQLSTIVSDGGMDIGGSCLSAAILSGQLGLFVVWGVLGSGRWLWRLLCLFMVLMTFWNFYVLLTQLNAYTHYYGKFSDLTVIQGVMLSVLAGVLRLSGYTLIPVDPQCWSQNDGRGRAVRQFGIRDVLIWTAVLAMLLGIARAANLLNVEFAKRFYGAEMLFVFTIAICTAAILIVALWAALGAGRDWLRWGVLVFMSTAIGVPVGVYCVMIMRRGGPWWLNTIWVHAQYWWIGWMILTGLLLAASLLIFRTQRYRLIKRASSHDRHLV